ncbi:MAG: prephenate dehydrogenase/arogenate dehydrogenase family protein [Lachnospiraceae bacterium]|nr:prephenate dehydrogenase/arogenate dehydrogenase family protein [Lachnospiraceae bacterium]
MEYFSFGFIGFGLIGGTIARALRKLYPDAHITGYNYKKTEPHKKLEIAVRENVLDDVTADINVIAECDVIFLCAPVLKNIAYLEELAPAMDCKKTMITDVGSVKGNILKKVEELGLEEAFVGGHPMTGLEKTGYEYSDEALLKGCYYIVSPTEKSRRSDVDFLKGFIVRAGAHPVVIDADRHDTVVAGISHGPHVVSAALVNTVRELDKDGIYHLLAAGGFRDITRISSSSPEMWHDICVANKDSIVEFLEQFRETLNGAEEAVRSGDDEKIFKYFNSAKFYRDTFM